jgi:hypothetical protein
MSSLHLRRPLGPDLKIDRDRSLIGREETCDVVIEDRSVSRRHVLIERRGGEWAVVDQGSANGTFLDGRRVGEATLSNGQELRVGTVVFRVEVEEEIAPTVMMSSVPDFDGATMMMAPPETPTRTSAGVASPPRAVAPAAAPVVPATAPAASARSVAAGAVVAPAPAPAAAVVPPAAPRSRASARPPAPASPPVPAGPDPYAVLGISPRSAPEQVRARFEERSQDLQVKLAGATSASQKETYERELVELNRAFRKLSPGPEPFADIADLPSAQPVVAADLLDGEAYGRVRPEEPVGEAAEAKGSDALLPASTSVLVFVGTGLLALFAFFGLASGKIEKTVMKEEQSPALANARQGAAKYGSAELLLRDHALHNGKLRLCNRASRPLEVKRLTAVFARPAEDMPPNADPQLLKLVSGTKIGSYNSAYCVHGDFKLSLAPGAETAVAFKSDEPRCNFDGNAIFYALAVQPPPGVGATAKGGRRAEAEPAAGAEAEPVWIAGLLNESDQCVAIGAGW